MALSETWFMEGYIDFELQKYKLLAYLNEVKRSFNETKLYPQLADIVFHYNNLISFRTSKKLLNDRFPKRMEGISLSRMELVYEHILADDELMQELECIMQYAIDEMKGTISEGAGIYDFVEKKLEIDPVGIIPLYKNEGYIFLRYGSTHDVLVYAFNVTFFEHKDAKYKGIKMEYIDSRVKNLANTYEQIKIDIIRSFRALPNPAVYKVEFPHDVPFHETLLPVAKRSLMRYIDAS